MGGMIPSTPRRRVHAPSPSPPLDDDDLLAEILLRLPPHPCSLLRAYLVCARWRRLLRDPGFLRRCRAFHRAPPVLGLYLLSPRRARFVPVGEPPDRAPARAAGFALPDPASWVLLGCRHGRALLRSAPGWLQLLVWDPLTAHRRRVRLGRLAARVRACNATVLGDPADPGRRDGSAFRVAFVLTGGGRASACLYSSDTGAWGRLLTAEARCDDVDAKKPSALAGGALYWMLKGGGIMEHRLGEEESLAVVEPPPPRSRSLYMGNAQLVEAEGGALGFAGVKEYSLHLWAREAGRDGAANWMLRKMIDLDGFALLQGLVPRIILIPPVKILGVDEGGNSAFLETIFGVFMVMLDTEQIKQVSNVDLIMQAIRPYSSFYVAGGVVAD